MSSGTGFAQKAPTADPKPVSKFAEAVLRTNSVAALRPRTVVDSIGRDPFALFDFVRDKIRFQAYRGVLRGAEGTLAAKAGNAWDQAVLLKTLFDYAGVHSNILRVGLEEKDARQLLDLMKAGPAPSEESFNEADLTILGLDLKRYPAASQKRINAIEKLIALVKQRSAADIAALEKAGSFSVSTPDLVSATRDYAWVQAEINGKPYDFHPAFPDGKQPVLLPAGVMQYVTSIPTSLFHWVRIRLFLERMTETGLDRTAILDKRVLPAVAAGAPSRIALRPEALNEKLLRLNPALTIGDQVFTGEGATVSAVDGKPLPGSATAMWLEVTLMSPGEPPRYETLTLADSLGEDRAKLGDESAQIEPVPLPRSAFDVSAELHFVTGDVPSTRWAEALAVSLERLANAASNKMTIESSGLFGLVPDNPLLTSWGALLASVAGSSYLDAPSAAVLVYTSADGSLTAKGRVLFSRYIDANSHRRDPNSAVASSLLFESLAERHGAKVHTSATYSLYQEGDFSDWDAASRVELMGNKERKYKIWLPANALDHWWGAEPSGGIMLNGIGGWTAVLPKSSGLTTTAELMSGEVARLVAGIPGDKLSQESAKKILETMMRDYAADQLSPLAPALSSLGIMDMHGR